MGQPTSKATSLVVQAVGRATGAQASKLACHSKLHSDSKIDKIAALCHAHSGCMDSKSIHSTIDAPPEVPGVSKNKIFFFTNKTVELLR